jgi:hypothetical protein
MNQFFVFGSLFEHCNYECADLQDMHNCDFYNRKTSIKNPVVYFLYKVHNSGILNRRMKMPFKRYWFRYFFDVHKVVRSGGAMSFCFLTPIRMYIIRIF